MTYYVALSFKQSEDAVIVAGEPREARSADAAIRIAAALATVDGRCGAIAFSRTGDPDISEFDHAVVLKAFGEVDARLLVG